jgi:hypothetical protein
VIRQRVLIPRNGRLIGGFDARFFVPLFDGRQELKSLRELVAAGQTEPAALHFEEALTKLRVRLEPGLVCAMFSVQTALARFPTHTYKHSAPLKAPRHPNCMKKKEYNMALQQMSISQRPMAFT